MPGWAEVPGSPVSSTLTSHLYFVTASPLCTKPGPAFTERALCTCSVMLPGPAGCGGRGGRSPRRGGDRRRRRQLRQGKQHGRQRDREHGPDRSSMGRLSSHGALHALCVARAVRRAIEPTVGPPTGAAGRRMTAALSRGSAGRHRGAPDTARSPSSTGHAPVIPPSSGWPVAPACAPQGGQIAIRPASHCMMRGPLGLAPIGGGPREGGPAVSTVLVVDDEERIRTLVTRTLTAEGHSVDTAGDGAAALDRLAARGGRPGPAGPGHAAVQRADGAVRRCASARTPTPVIVLSGVTDVAARVQALDRGAVDVVAKPFSLAELLARTRRHLAAARTAPRATHRFLTAGGIRLDLDRRRATRGRPRGVADRARVRAAGAPDAPARATSAAARSCCTTSGGWTSTRAATSSRSASAGCATSCSRTPRSRRSAVSATASTAD